MCGSILVGIGTAEVTFDCRAIASAPNVVAVIPSEDGSDLQDIRDYLRKLPGSDHDWIYPDATVESIVVASLDKAGRNFVAVFKTKARFKDVRAFYRSRVASLSDPCKSVEKRVSFSYTCKGALVSCDFGKEPGVITIVGGPLDSDRPPPN